MICRQIHLRTLSQVKQIEGQHQHVDSGNQLNYFPKQSLKIVVINSFLKEYSCSAGLTTSGRAGGSGKQASHVFLYFRSTSKYFQPN